MSVIYKPFMLSVVMLNVLILRVMNKPLMLNVVILNVVMVSVVAPPFTNKLFYIFLYEVHNYHIKVMLTKPIVTLIPEY
jgi:NADH:ubiquinone oxidoreductase subunit K